MKKAIKRIGALLLALVITLSGVPFLGAFAMNSETLWSTSFETEGERSSWKFYDVDGDGDNMFFSSSYEAYRGSWALISDSQELQPDNIAVGPEINIETQFPTVQLSWSVSTHNSTKCNQTYTLYAYTGSGSLTADMLKNIDSSKSFTAIKTDNLADVATGDYVSREAVIDTGIINYGKIRLVIRNHNTNNQSLLKFDSISLDAFVESDELWSCDFENASVRNQWTFNDADGDKNNWGFDTAFFRSGEYAISSYSFRGGKALTPNNFAISPEITLAPNYKNLELDFYAGANSKTKFSENFAIYIYKSDETPDFDNLKPASCSETLKTNEFTLYRVDLDDYCGETIKIIIRHTGSNNSRLTVDDLSISGVYFKEEVSEVKLNLEAPRKGSKPSSADVISGSASAATTWSTSGENLAASDVFEDGKSYSAVINVQPLENYTFTEDTVFILNGINSEAVSDGNGGYTLSTEYYIDKELSEISIDIQDPTAGSKLPAPSAAEAGVEVSYQWLENGSDVASDYICKDGNAYEVKISVSAEDKFVIAEDAVFKINGIAAEAEQSGAVYSFNKSYYIDKKLSNIAISVEEPEIGSPLPSASVSGDNGGIELTSEWFAGDTKLGTEYICEDGTTYTLVVSMQVKQGFTLSDDSAFSMNGSAVEPVFEDGKYIVESEFTTDKLIKNVSINIEAPEAGKTPGEPLIIKGDEGITLSYNWIETESGETVESFENGKEYEINISLKAASGYAFAENAEFVLDGAAASDYDISDDGSYTFTKEYALTRAIDSISVSVAEVLNGEALPQPEITSEPDTVDYSCEWYENGVKVDNGTVCSEDTDYELKITFTAYNNNIDGKTKIMLNGELVTASTEDGVDYTISSEYHTGKKISAVDLSVEAPVLNAEQTTPSSTEPGAEISGKWFDGTAEKAMQKSAVFERGKTYYAVITVSAKSGYEFSDEVVFTLNGEAVSAEKSDDGSYIINSSDYEFNDVVNYVNIKIEAPKAECAQTEPRIVSDCEEIKYEYEWLNGEEKLSPEESFAEGTTYTLSIVFEVPENYDVEGITSFTVNDESVDAVLTENGSYAITAEFTTDTLIELAGIELASPEIGKNPQNPVLGDGNENISVSCKWYCKETASELGENDIFEAGKTYYAQLTFTPAENHEFTELTKFSVNGSAVSAVLSADDKSFVAEYSFGGLENISIENVSVDINAPKTNAAITDITDSEAYSVENTEWKCFGRLTGDEQEIDSDTFSNLLYKYTYSFELKAKDGYEFAENVSFSKIGGVEPEVTVADEGKTCTVKYDFSDVKDSSTLYTVVWTANGETIESSTYESGQAPMIPANIPTEPGKYFCYWSTDGVNEVALSAVESDIEYIAVFGNEEYTISFDVGDEVGIEAPESKKVKYGETVNIPDYSKEGYTFYWTDGVHNCVGEYTVEDLGETGTEIILTVHYTPDAYIARFKADGKTVALVDYDISTESLEAPELPEKAGYNGKWEDYTLTPGGITVNAVYELITYEARFYEDYDNELLTETVSFTVEDKMLKEPEVPEHTGYIGKWEDYSIAAEDLIIKAVYTPIEFEATFIDADGNSVDVIKFTLDDEMLEEPEVPKLDGYDGKWEDYSIIAEDFDIKAVYTPTEYKAEFYDIDDNLVDTVTFTVEYPVLDEPEVPAREGYDGKWSEYTVGIGDLKIKAEYTPITYYAKFFADGKSVCDAIEFTVESTEIIAPEIPVKEGYSGEWQEFSIQPKNLKVNAVYTPIEYEAKFFADDVQIGEPVKFTVETDSIEEPAIPEKEGYTSKWQKYMLWTSDIEINAVYTPINYTAKFYDNDVQIGDDVTFTVEYEEIDEPDVPQHIGYTGKWSDYTIGAKDLTINAEYTPIKYKAEFFDGDTQVGETLSFTVETEALEEPAVPEHIGYTGKWSSYTIGAGNLKIKAEYTPIVYNAKFFDGDTQVGETLSFTVETKALTEPAVPEHIGYTGKWSSYKIGAEDLTINAEYTPIEYKARFYDGDKQVGTTLTFTVETTSLKEPAVPEHIGYTGKWADYTIGAGDLRITAEYTPIVYNAEFFDGNTQVGETLTFTVETTSLKEPAVPEHIGYTGKWSSYKIGAGNLKINAEYTPIIYTAKFISEGRTIKNINYTVQTTELPSSDIPSVPNKNGYTGVWENYELKLGGTTINAIYTCISSLRIKNNPGTKTIKYREGLNLTAEVNNIPDNAKIVWYVNGSKYCEGTKFEKLDNRSDFEVTVKLIGSDGKCLTDANGNEIQEKETVKIDAGFFVKIIAFFKSIFGGNPTIVQ